MATLKSEKKGINTSVAYVIFDKQGIIQELSSSALNLLELDKIQMMKKKIY